MPPISLYCRFLLILLVIASSWSVDKAHGGDGAQQIALDADKSYAITASLTVSYPWRSDYRYEVEEIYSAWQKRSRVRYRTVSKTMKKRETLEFADQGLLYSDGQQVLVLDEEGRNCALGSNELADKIFNLNILKAFAYSPIIGPSRFLHFARANYANTLAKTVVDEAKFFRDEPGMSRFDYSILDRTRVYALYYHEDSAKNLPYGIPAMLIALIKGFEDYVLTYQFKRIEILPDGPIYGSVESLARPFNSESEAVSLDALTIPPLFNCGREQRSLADTRDKLLLTNFRFSFKAQASTTGQAEQFHMFVGYEPSISTLRVDRVGQTRVTETMINFYTARAYHTIKRLAAKDLLLDSLLKVRERDQLDDNLSCVVLEAPTSSFSLGASFTLGLMLFGSNDFSYLGLARVRGIEARVYETFNSAWPVWLQQPVSYHTTTDWINVSPETKTRPSIEPNGDQVLSTIVYMSDAHEAANQHKFEGNLLQIEVRRLDAKTLEIIDTTLVSVYDFTWRLTGASPMPGVSSESFYSLGDSCVPPSAEDNHYGHVQLSLVRDWPLNDEEESKLPWLAKPVHRNFALMKVAQESCSLPASMIYDVDSRFGRAASGPLSEMQSVLSLLVSVRVVEHPRTLVQLIYIGRAKMKEGQRKNFLFFLAVSFQTCYFVAAHKKYGTLFAFDPLETRCYIYKGSVIGTAKMTIQSTFEITPTGRAGGSLEVYRLRHTRNSKQPDDELTSLTLSQDRFNHLSRMTLVDPEGEGAELSLAVKSYQVTELDEKTPFQIDELQFSDTNKFLGFGLVACDKQNKRIQAGRLQTTDWLEQDDESTTKFNNLLSDMTFGQCQAACLADFKCQSYSVCMRNSRVDCVLSEVSFRSPMLVLQLLQVQDKRSKMGEKISLFTDSGLEEDKIRIERNPICELHNKFYSDLFKASKRRVSLNLLQRRLHPVAHREQCAAQCFESTMKLLRGDLALAGEATWSVLNRPESDIEEINRLFEEYKRAHLNTCSSFLYLDKLDLLKLNANQRRLAERQVVDKNPDEIANGYCVLGESLTEEEKRILVEARAFEGDTSLTKLPVRLEQYIFDFTQLFEQHYGHSLVASRMGSDERAAYELLTRPTGNQAAHIPLEQFQKLKLFVDKGENIGQTIVSDVDTCARACFLQLLNMWPGCRSFDVLEVSVGGARELHCFFNSISLSDALHAERFDLIRDHPSEQARLPPKLVTKVTHFEPKRDFVGQSLSLATQLNLDKSCADEFCSERMKRFRLGIASLLLTLLVALSAGVSIGVIFGDRVMQQLQRKQKENDDVEVLVQRPTIEFANLVNYEGHISS